MKTATALLSLVLTAAFSLSAAAQDVAGSWKAESINSVEPPEGISLVLAFGENNTATVTYTLAGEPQAWQYTYAVAEGQLTLEATDPFGEPSTVTYDIKLEDGKLLLLTPKPEPVEEEAETEEGAEDAEEGEASEEEAAEAEAEEEAEEEDTRVPVWVLVKA